MRQLAIEILKHKAMTATDSFFSYEWKSTFLIRSFKFDVQMALKISLEFLHAWHHRSNKLLGHKNISPLSLYFLCLKCYLIHIYFDLWWKHHKHDPKTKTHQSWNFFAEKWKIEAIPRDFKMISCLTNRKFEDSWKRMHVIYFIVQFIWRHRLTNDIFVSFEIHHTLAYAIHNNDVTRKNLEGSHVPRNIKIFMKFAVPTVKRIIFLTHASD